MGQLAHQVKAFIAQVLMEFPELMGSPDVRKLLQNRESSDQIQALTYHQIGSSAGEIGSRRLSVGSGRYRSRFCNSVSLAALRSIDHFRARPYSCDSKVSCFY
jgi:hypothetical protein